MSVKKINVINPVLKNKEHYITSDFYERNNTRSKHKGIDMIGKNRATDYVIAIDDGVVITSTYSKTAGYYVEIKHKNNYISRYLHMKKNSLKVRKKDYVKKGDILGFMGNTGASNGAHLHFAVFTKNKIVDDPLLYLQNVLNFNSTYYEDFIYSAQGIFKVKQDGIAGKKTLNNTITVSRKINRTHPIVKVIQVYLYNIGYTEIGKSDGIAGPKFTSAVKRFQKEHNCYVDGIITKKNKTWKKLLKLL